VATAVKVFDLTLPALLKRDLFGHLFPGDADEHGAVIGCGVVETERGLRLLARDLMLAKDGVDYVPGKAGYRMLTAQFVMKCADRCSRLGLAYLAVHNHGGTTSVDFSGPDMASHERGYPALLDVVDGPPVGALVFATRAVAGDLWLPDGSRRELREAKVVGTTVGRLYPKLPPRPAVADETYDRQARLFGDRGQALLRESKVGVIGAGGVGALVGLYMARLGVGRLVVVEPERVDITNLPRLPGATRFDARTWLTAEGRPEWLRRLGERIAARKLDIVRREVRRTGMGTVFEGICADVSQNDVAMRLRDCDYLFLAADTATARLVFNALAHQYLIPGVQVGSKVPVDEESGEVGDVFSVVRPVLPDSGCLWCAKLINPTRLAEEAQSPEERERHRYLEEIPAPSVITLNAIGAGHAANEFLFSLTGLREPGWHERYFRYHPRPRDLSMDTPLREPECAECGLGPKSRRAMGDARELPTRVG